MHRIDVITPDWPAPANVYAAVTSRAGGVSEGPYESLNLSTRTGDDPRAVTENRRRLSQALDLPGEPLWLKQVHGNHLVTHRARDDDPTADASWTDQPGAVCAVLTADCLPLLLCGRAGAWVSAVHCGWRGLAGGIVESVLRELPGKAADTLAWLGPAIGPNVFEVGAEVHGQFLTGNRAPPEAFREAQREGFFQCDLTAIARHQLAAGGVGEVSGGGWCTVTDAARFFSFRRDGDTGRMATLIWLNRH